MPTDPAPLYVTTSPARVAVWLVLGLTAWATLASVVLVAARLVG